VQKKAKENCRTGIVEKERGFVGKILILADTFNPFLFFRKSFLPVFIAVTNKGRIARFQAESGNTPPELLLIVCDQI